MFAVVADVAVIGFVVEFATFKKCSLDVETSST